MGVLLCCTGLEIRALLDLHEYVLLVQRTQQSKISRDENCEECNLRQVVYLLFCGLQFNTCSHGVSIMSIKITRLQNTCIHIKPTHLKKERNAQDNDLPQQQVICKIDKTLSFVL